MAESDEEAGAPGEGQELLPPDDAPPHQLANMVVLSTLYVLYLSAFTAQLTASSLAAKELGYNSLATLPLAATFGGQVIGVLPASWLQRNFGRQVGFAAGGVCGMASGAVGWVAMHWRSFPVLCVAGTLLGCFGASAQFIRYAAAESCSKAFQARALSWVMSGGAVLSVIGPEVATIAHAIGGYAGLYAALGGVAVLFELVNLLLRLPLRSEEDWAEDEEPAPRQRGLCGLLGELDYVTAVLGCFGAFWAMVLVMTGTPVYMKDDGFGLARTANTIQVHLLGMFLPGFATGHVIDCLGAPTVLLVGALLFCGVIPILHGAERLDRYMPGLGLLGIAWNFVYVSSTKVLVAVPMSSAEAATGQAANELFTACGDTAASLLAAVIIHEVSWNALLWFSAPFTIPAAVLAAVGVLRRRCLSADAGGVVPEPPHKQAAPAEHLQAADARSVRSRASSRQTHRSARSAAQSVGVGTYVSQHSLA
eukprot:TRINITY_DN55756_c0_g1_i1.p1 TRINITY_DN55756_c0_g1~~TRINITY_DN55756_c0_g1_i1.p1  ORF type:complete len:506 (+),score=145.21 TRINITY_DN55756_c0_g1_i1:82-1518(+)